MQIRYLRIQRGRPPNLTWQVSVVPSLDQAVSEWRASTRISPILQARTDEVGLQGKSLIFLCRVQPSDVRELIDESRVWLTFGLYNVVAVCESRTERRSIATFARERKAAFEWWGIGASGSLEKQRHWHAAPDRNPSAHSLLGRLGAMHPPTALRESYAELLPLLASAIARSEIYAPVLVSDLLQVGDWVERQLRRLLRFEGARLEAATYKVLGEFTSLNAGLSRFTSQCFSGASPITETECHYWTHSLLGTGLANLALRNFCQFATETLGEYRIPERVASFSHAPVQSGSLLEHLASTSPFWDRDFLNEVPDPPVDEPIVPPITCFSGRDGFKSTEETVSASLAVIGSCNSARWTLRTVTHELSHLVVRGTLGALLPREADGREWALALLDRYPHNLREAATRFLLSVVIAMDDLETDAGMPQTESELRDLLFRWRNDVEELMAHILDFWYFYEDDPKAYIRGIWLSWSALPNIGGRVREYVLRTLVAVASRYIRFRGEALERARNDIEDELKSLRDKGHGSEYVTEALACLQDEWDLFNRRGTVRLGLAQLVRTMMVSQRLRAKVRTDRYASGPTDHHGGYPFTAGLYESDPIENPILFVERYTQNRSPDPFDSHWMLTTLALNYANASAE